MEKKKSFLIVAIVAVVLWIGLAVLWFGVLWPTDQKTEVITVELGDKVSKDPADYLEGHAISFLFAKIDVSAVNDKKLGDYTATCKHGRTEYTYKVSVVDTTAPTIKTKKDGFYLAANRTYEIKDVIKSVKDKSGDVTLTAKVNGKKSKEIFFDDTGKEKIKVIAKDSSGNESSVEISVNVDTAPVIAGAKDFYVLEDMEQDLLERVTAIDDVDGDLTKEMEFTGDVDWESTGDYDISYEVTDQYGLETKVECQVHVMEEGEIEELIATRQINRWDAYIYGATNLYCAGAAEMGSIYEQEEYMKPCVVHITDMDDQGYGWWGSGFIIDIRDGYVYICSNNHVLRESAETSTVFFFDGTEVKYEVVTLNEEQDVGIAKVDMSLIPEETMDKLVSVQINQEKATEAEAGGVSCFMQYAGENGVEYAREGETVGLSSEFTGLGDQTLETTVRSESGNSGSAIIDENGYLVGMIVGRVVYGWNQTMHEIRVANIIATYQNATGNTLYQ